MKRVKMEVMSSGAVYINDTRVTGRGTKWGSQHVVWSGRVCAHRVTANLIKHGFGHIKLDPVYALEEGIV